MVGGERLRWLEHLPKVELHLHLEGAIPHEALLELVRKYCDDGAAPGMQELAEKFRFRDFSQFIACWNWKNGFLREYDDFTFIAEAVAASLARQRIVYAEVFFSPGDFKGFGLQTQKLAQAIRTGLARVEGTEVNLVADLVRDYGPEQAERTLREIQEVKQLGIVGIGIGGTEHRFPPDLFEQVYALARRFGFNTSAHAGETSGPESIWTALRLLRVDRIGHATRAIEDDRLLECLAEKQVPVEICPISNIRTGVASSIESHPVGRYLQRGLLVTVNTDDPAMFGNSLAGELDLLAETFGLSESRIRALMLNAASSAWISPDRRGRLKLEIKEG